MTKNYGSIITIAVLALLTACFAMASQTFTFIGSCSYSPDKKFCEVSEILSLCAYVFAALTAIITAILACVYHSENPKGKYTAVGATDEDRKPQCCKPCKPECCKPCLKVAIALGKIFSASLAMGSQVSTWRGSCSYEPREHDCRNSEILNLSASVIFLVTTICTVKFACLYHEEYQLN